MTLSLQLNIFSFFLILAAVATVTISILLLRREALASRIFGVTMGVLSLWAFGYGMELMHSDLSDMMFWIRVEYIGVGFIPALWFLFCASYSGHDKYLTPRNASLVMVIPVITLLMVWTNDLHYLHYSRVEVDTDSGPFPMLDFTPGIWYWTHTVYFYILLVWGTYLLLQNFRKSDPLFKRQTLTVLIGALIPWAVNALYLAGYKPYSHLDLTPFVFTLTGLVIAYGLLQYRLFDMLPIARDKLIENLADGVIVTDGLDRIVFSNHTMQRILGIEDGLVGRKSTEVLKHFKNILSELESPNNNRFNVEYSNGDRTCIFEVSNTRITDLRNIKTGNVMVFHDITEFQKNQRQLEAAMLKAEESDRLKTSFLANMSHEIRNPMNGIIGFAGFIKDPETTESDRIRYAEIIEKNAVHLMGIINDIIDISKIESGHDKIRNDTMSVSELMNDLSSFFYESARKKGLELNFASTVSESNDYIVTDPQKLRQILVNLINNAIKFTDEGKVTVRVRKLNEELIFTVTDTGIGITKEDLDHIFVRFKQSFEDRSRTYGGTGLGLSISKAYAEMLDGRIQVTSKVRAGSTFTLIIPHFPAERIITLFDESDDMKDKNFIEPDWSGKTILVAEDEPVNMMYIKIELKNTKVNLVTAETGAEAVRAFEKNPNVNLILMDIKMPEMDGFEASELIRAKNVDIPIIALSGHAMVEQKKLDRAGFTDLISKPVKKIDLINGINRWIG